MRQEKGGVEDEPYTFLERKALVRCCLESSSVPLPYLHIF